MHLTRSPIHLARLDYPEATEQQIAAYGLELEHIMTAFTDDENDE